MRKEQLEREHVDRERSFVERLNESHESAMKRLSDTHKVDAWMRTWDHQQMLVLTATTKMYVRELGKRSVSSQGDIFASKKDLNL